MATIKSFTSLEQSRKLAEFLPLESADYFHAPDAGVVVTEPYKLKEDDETVITAYKGAVPCWSLAALLSILPKIGSEEPIIQKLYYVSNPVERYICQYSITNITGEYDNPVDACYEMILKLHELKML